MYFKSVELFTQKLLSETTAIEFSEATRKVIDYLFETLDEQQDKINNDVSNLLETIKKQ